MSLERSSRRTLVAVNYFSLVLMNICFHIAFTHRDMGHLVDVVGLLAVLMVAVTFVPAQWRSGLWKLTHARADQLDERELQLTHRALGLAYGWFAVTCLTLLLVHAVLFRLVAGLDFVITVPLVGSLIYLAHTLPGSILAWTEDRVPGAAS